MDSLKNDWPKKAVMQLIQMWEGYEFLYNTSHNLYHNKHVRQDAFKDIAEALQELYPNVTANDVKTKISNLRGQYTRLLAKQRDSRYGGSGIEEQFEPKVYWFDKIHFLDEHITARKVASNTTCLEDTDSSPTVEEQPPATKKRCRQSVPKADNTEAEDNLIEIATKTLVALHSTTTSDAAANNVDVAFCKFLQVTLTSIRNQRVKDDLCEAIMIQLCEARKRDRQYNEVGDG